MNFPDIWYASEEKMKSTTKVINFEDIGSLDVSSGGLQFSGKKEKFQISRNRIKNVSVARQTPAWMWYIIGNAFTIALFYTMSFIFLSLPFVNIPFPMMQFIGLLAAGNVFSILVNRSTKWVLVEFSDQKGFGVNAYFADGTAVGWSGIFGGTERLLEAIKS